MIFEINIGTFLNLIQWNKILNKYLGYHLYFSKDM